MEYLHHHDEGHAQAWVLPLEEDIDDRLLVNDGLGYFADETAARMTAVEARKRLGIKVLLFLFVLTGLLYAVKRKIWSDVH